MSKRKKKEFDEEDKKFGNIYEFKNDDIEEEADVDLNIYKNGEDDNTNKVFKFHKGGSKLKIIILSIIAIVMILLLASYTTNQTFRNYVDTYIFKKQITENSLETIEINADDNPTIFAYNNYIGVLSKNILNLYNSRAQTVSELSINVSNAIVETSGRYAVIAESNGNEFYVINNTEISWQGRVDGNISKVNINQNGYVTVITSDPNYVSIVIVFNSDGTELFKTYLPSTYAMCAAVSTDNSYLAIGEIDYSGTVLKSNVRVMSVISAELVYNYSSDDNSIITNIKYYDNENALCSYTDSIVSVSPTGGNEIYTMSDNTCFMDIEMQNQLVVLEKQSSGLFSYEYNLRFTSLNSNAENLYILNNNLPSQMKVSENLVALNYGNEVDIVNSSGALKKNYTSSQQIKDVIVGDDIAGIIYKDKIEVIDI